MLGMIGTGIAYGFSIGAGFKTLSIAITIVKDTIGRAIKRGVDAILFKYQDRINRYLKEAKGSRSLLKKLVAGILKELHRLYGKYRLGLTDDQIPTTKYRVVLA